MAVNYEQPSGTAPQLPSPEVPAVRALIPHRWDPEATLPPTPLRELLASSGASVCVLTADNAFVDVIERAAGEQYPLSVVHTWPELQTAVDSGQCGIALLDATLLGDRAMQCIAQLTPYAHRLVVLVAADRTSATELVGLLAERRIHRLLMKPSAVGATRLLIESAVTRRIELREQHPDEQGAEVAHTGASQRRRWIIGLAATVGVAVVAAAAARLQPWRERAVAPAAAIAVPAALPDPAAELRQRVDALHAQAELARTEGRLSDPSGTGALEQYAAILALVPDDARARNGVVSVVDGLFTRAEEALLAGSLDEAATTLDQVRQVQPTSTRLAFLDTQLVRALAVSVPAAPVAEPVSAAAPTELDSMLSLAAARLRRGQLVSPAGDNARDYLNRARALDPSNAEAAALRAELGAALVASARLVAGSDVDAAAAIAEEARRQGATASELATLEQELTAARERLARRQGGETLTAARALIRAGALFAPAENHALAVLLSVQNDTPDAEGLALAWAEYRAAVRDVSEAAADADDWATAEAGLAALRETPDGATLANQLADEFAARRLQAQFLAEVIPASQLTMLSAPPAAYPQEAIDSNIEGWVDVEFIVDRTGRPRDGRVVDARPRVTFDGAALAALAGYRYEPFESNGRTYERRVRQRIRFVIR